MRRFLLLPALLAACIHGNSSRSIHGPALGRVVVYRNGVAFYERKATAVDGKVTVRVPRERVDDFLKSLTVVDRDTGRPIPVSIPRRETDDGSGEHNYLTMTLETPGHRRANVMLTYITDAPAWRPSYRVVVGPKGKVMLEGWAIVDNLSGEDWKDVQVGVGASSALSFRYDLWSVHHVDRDLLQGDETFAVAPPTGVSPYAENAAPEELASFGNPGATTSDSAGVAFSGSSSLENQYVVDGVSTTGTTFGTSTSVSPDKGTIEGAAFDKTTGEPLAGVTVVLTSPALQGSNQTAVTDEHGLYKIGELPPGDYSVTFYYADISVVQKTKVAADQVARVTQKLDESKAGGETIQVAARAPMIDRLSTTSGVTIDRDHLENLPVPGRTFESALGAAAGSQTDDFGRSHRSPPAKAAPPPPPPDPLHAVAAKVTASKKDLLIEAHGTSRDEVAARADKIRDKLVDEGVPVKRIHVAAKVGPTESQGLRLLAVAPGTAPESSSAPPRAHTQTADTPVGESHFIAEQPMTVRAGSSAMVAMVHGETDGGVVYLYDPISERGDQKYAFKAIHLINPTHDTLEPGPVTVYGDGRFVGEGITEPVPPDAAVVVPFALDREVVVNPVTTETDRIAKLETVQRGQVTAEVQHRRDTRYTITSRLADKATVYLRHKLETGWQLVAQPGPFLRVGDSQLFEITLKPGETRLVDIAEAAPVQRSFELSSDDALDMMKVYIDEPDASPELKKQIEALLATHRGAGDIRDKIKTLRDELVELQGREGELHAQIVTLRAVRTGGELMATLRTKLAEISDRIQKTTIAIVNAQEELMLQRVKFGNQLAELHLTDATVSKR
ncbi:MAG: carboxypeptidase regulatory-like domain-containing protein [Acidobacteriota bacterium]